MWADAICIDQSNVEERAQQVAMMQQIYTKASNVIVWLGEGDDRTREDVSKAMRIAANYAAEDGWEYDDPYPMHVPLDRSQTEFNTTDCQIFENDWFRRAWVVPEVFNSRVVRVQLGRSSVPWSLLLRMNRCISRAAWRPAQVRRALMPALFEALFDADRCTGNIASMSEINPTTMGQLDSLDTLVRAADLDATDPRDKVFALVGLSEVFQARAVDSRIVPDYTKSVARVFADFTRWWIIQNKSLRILSGVHISVGRTWQRLSLDTPVDDSRPSWSFWHDGRSTWSKATLGLWQTCRYRASSDLAPDISLIESEADPLRLRLRGCCIDRIHAIQPFPYAASFGDPALGSLRKVSKLLCEPRNYRKVWSSETGRHDLEDRADLKLSLEDSFIQDHLRTHLGYAKEHGGALECHSAIYVTTNGGIRGLCPPMAEVGDRIVCLYGGRVPYVLRKTSGRDDSLVRYALVGECYLQGYMHGRAIDRVKASGHACEEEVYDIY